MLHVNVKTNNMGVRKAWYIEAIPSPGKTRAVVVFKNNDNRVFREVFLEDISLDTSFKPEVSTVEDNSLRSVNLRLKNKLV